MTNKKDWRTEFQQLAEQLRDPFRMRMAVAGVAMAAMFFAISEPLHGRMKQEKRDLSQLETKVKTAEEVMLLRDHLDAVEPRILQGGDSDVVVAHLIDIVRSQSVDMMRIDSESPSRLGPLQSIGVSVDVTGSFAELAELLHRLESDPYLLRVERVSISPSDRDGSEPMMQVSLRMLKDGS